MCSCGFVVRERRLCHAAPVSLVIVADCESASKLLNHERLPAERWQLMRIVQHMRSELALFFVEVILTWIPSHFRVVESWVPFPAFSCNFLRALNDAADKAASEAFDRAFTASHRRDWHL